MRHWGVSRLPRVISPVRPLFLRNRVEVALISVEVWPTHLIVRLAALPGEIAGEQQRTYEAEFEQWGNRLHAGDQAAGGPPDPPDPPGTRLLAPLEIVVEDDAGTIFTPRSSNTAGTGREWHGAVAAQSGK